jgi:MOSC domain-containing protein YiiM
MGAGSLLSIHIARRGGERLESVREIRAVPGLGLEGDRYHSKQGTFSGKKGTGREVTLIESEALEALRRDYDVALDAGDTRRNLITRGVPLNHLVGRTFRVGGVSLHGVRLCEPCAHLAQLTCAKASAGLVHRGGLRAEILTAGTLQAGSSIEWE